MISNSEGMSKHRQLKSKMLDEIRRGELNSRLPSERELSKKFNVCRATMAKVMGELMQEGYVTRHVGKGTFVTPRDKIVHMSNALAPRTRGEIIITYPDFFSYEIWELVHFAELEALKRNVNLVNHKLQANSSLELLMHTLETNKNVKGVFMVSMGKERIPAVLRKLDSFNIPIVIGNIIDSAIGRKNIYSVAGDHRKDGYLKMDCLLRKGHRRIGYVMNEPVTEVGKEHVKGIKQALYDNNMRLKDLKLPRSRANFWGDPAIAGYQQTKELLGRHKLTALLFDSISGTMGGLRALHELKLNCPDDVSVVTSLSCFGMEKMTCPAMSTVVFDNKEIVKTAYDVILNPEKTASRNFIIDAKLIERESVRRIS